MQLPNDWSRHAGPPTDHAECHPACDRRAQDAGKHATSELPPADEPTMPESPRRHEAVIPTLDRLADDQGRVPKRH